MPLDKRTVINNLAIFTDASAMRAKYGIIITPTQIETAQKVLKTYQNMSEQEFKKLNEKTINKWPFHLNEDQRYDKLLYRAPLSMTQQILWQTIKAYLVKHPDERKTDRDSILRALTDMEGFLLFNMYNGNFEENKKITNENDTKYLLKLFSLSYSKYATEKARENKYDSQ